MEIEKELSTASECVRDLLLKYPRCRDSAMWLCFTYWREMDGVQIYIPFAQVSGMTSPETILRCRRKIQNKEGEFLPSDDVLNMRDHSEEKTREHFGRKELKEVPEFFW